MKTIDLCDQKTAPLTPKSFIYNRRSYSQAGRRGFESHLPLHVFMYLQGFGVCRKPSFRGNEANDSLELLDRLILERLTGSEPRWHSRQRGVEVPMLPYRVQCGSSQLRKLWLRWEKLQRLPAVSFLSRFERDIWTRPHLVRFPMLNAAKDTSGIDNPERYRLLSNSSAKNQSSSGDPKGMPRSCQSQ